MKTSTYFKVLFSVVVIAILFNFYPRHCEAQITITESDLPAIGSVALNISDTIPSVGPGAAGAGQTWDLTAFHNDVVDSLYFLSPASSLYFSSFPTSNILYHGVFTGHGVNYEYDFENSDSVLVQGTVTEQGTITAYGSNTPAVLGVPFPATYLTHWYGSYINIEKYSLGSGDSLKGIILESNLDTVDGWGSVTTPAAVYPNALRVKQITKMVYDSDYYYLSGTGWMFIGATISAPIETFEWLVNGGQYQVAELSFDSVGGSPSSGGYLLSTVTGIAQLNHNLNAQVYPNPASSSISIQVSSVAFNGFIKVTDITGRVIENSKFANSKAVLNTFGYPNGMYIYEITGMSGNLVDKGKFCVTH